MLPREDRTSDDVPDGQHGRDVAHDLTHTSIRDHRAIIIDALDGKEPHIRRQDHSRLHKLAVREVIRDDNNGK